MILQRCEDPDGCEATAVVGVGPLPTWLCMDHADAWLADLGVTLREVRQRVERMNQARRN